MAHFAPGSPVQICSRIRERFAGLWATKAVQLASESEETEINQSGLMRDFVGPECFQDYKYHIDIDGNTNSWPGLFQKLLTGSPVLKVASSSGYRQWYYDRLEPWGNFVPVSADFSDLLDKVAWLRDNDHIARKIGVAGRVLALSMTVQSEVRRASDVVAGAFRWANEMHKDGTDTPDLAAQSVAVVGSGAAINRSSADSRAIVGHRSLSPASPDGHFARGEVKLHRGQLEEAERDMRRAVELAPEDPRFLNGLSSILQRLGRWEEGLDCARSAVEADPSNGHFHSTLAYAGWRCGALAEAEKAARSAVALDPTNPHIRGLMANFLMEHGELGEAVIHASRACALAPDQASFHHLLSRILARQKRLQEAVAASQRAIELNPKEHHHHLHLALVLAELGDLKRARAVMREAVLLQPDNAHLRSHYGHLLARMGHKEEARDEFSAAVKLAPNDAVFRRFLSGAYIQLGQNGEAIAAMRAPTSLQPGQAWDFARPEEPFTVKSELAEAEQLQCLTDKQATDEGSVGVVEVQEPNESYQASMRRGRSLAAAGQAQQAVAAFREALRHSSGEAEAHDALGRTLVEAGQPEEGMVELRGAIALKPGIWEYHHHLAKALEKTDRVEEAEAEIRKVIELRPDNGDLQGYHGHMLARLGRIEDAVAAFERAIALSPDNAGVHGALSHALNRLGRTGDAVRAIRKAMELRQPESAPDYAHFGNLLRLQDDYLGAIAAYEKAVALTPDNEEYAKQLGALRATPVARTDSEREAQKAQVDVGQDGWLFHKVDDVFEQVCEGQGLSERNHLRLLSLWEARHAWCGQRGMDYRIFIVPERHVLYPDKLPAGCAPSEERPALRKLHSADRFLRPAIIYPDAAIRAGRAVREVCYKTDVHWARWGAYLGYRELIETLPRCAGQIIQEHDLKVTEHTLTGGLTLWLDRRDRETAVWMEPPPVGDEEIFTTRTFKPGQVDVYETKRRNLPRLVLFRTSNSTHLLPFLFHHFSRIVAVASVAVHFELLRSEQPDVVISEISERYIAPRTPNPLADDAIRFPTDFDLLSFSEFTGVTLPLPRWEREALETTEAGAAELTDLEKVAREMCVRDSLPESQWHLYIGKALAAVTGRAA
jgi:alginate O-acetyltransferase complex protein AlgJ